MQGKTFYFRRYPVPYLAPHVVGYSTQSRARAGLEQSQNAYLTASNSDIGTLLDKLGNKLEGKTITGNNIVLNLEPKVQNLAQGELRDAAAKSNAAIAQFDGKVTWEHSYVVADKTFCIYIADSKESGMEHARISGFPANKVTEVRTVIEPLTAL